MTQDILIKERKSEKLISATFYDDLGASQLLEAESQWKPFRDATIQRLLAAGKKRSEIQRLIQHIHWNWVDKAGCLLNSPLAPLQCFGIKLEERWQGLIMMNLATHRAQVEPDSGKPLVYVECLETAPWNLKDFVEEPLYGLIGPQLMEAAIRLSLAEGFRGRVGLLALPQSEKFYEKKVGMVHVKELDSHNMKYYELTQEAAKAYLKGDR